MSRIVLGLLGLAVALAAILWIAVPPLISPTAAPPAAASPPSDWLAQALVASPAGQVEVRLTPVVATSLLAQELTPGSAAAHGPFYSAGVTFGPGAFTLRLFGNLPGQLRVPGWSGAPFQLDLQVRPSLPDPGVLQLQLESVRLGRIPVSTVISPARLLGWLLRAAPLRGSGVSVYGGSVLVDLATLPPLHLPQTPEVALRVEPVSLGLSPADLSLALSAQGSFTATPEQFLALLSQWLGPGSPMQLGAPLFSGGHITLALPAASGALQPYVITPSVPQPGVLQLSVAAPGSPLGLAAWLDAALGAPPPWLHVVQGAVDIDFRHTSPFQTPGLAALHLLPTAAEVVGGELRIQFEVGLAPAGG